MFAKIAMLAKLNLLSMPKNIASKRTYYADYKKFKTNRARITGSSSITLSSYIEGAPGPLGLTTETWWSRIFGKGWQNILSISANRISFERRECYDFISSDYDRHYDPHELIYRDVLYAIPATIWEGFTAHLNQDIVSALGLNKHRL